MNNLSVCAAVEEARAAMGNPPGVYPLLPSELPARPEVKMEPSRSEVLTELRRLLASAKTVYPARVKSGALPLEVAWHRLECLAVAVEMIERETADVEYPEEEA